MRVVGDRGPHPRLAAGCTRRLLDPVGAPVATLPGRTPGRSARRDAGQHPARPDPLAPGGRGATSTGRRGRCVDRGRHRPRARPRVMGRRRDREQPADRAQRDLAGPCGTADETTVTLLYDRPVTGAISPDPADDFALVPTAERDDLALSDAFTPLAPIITEEIRAGGGRITFERFMALALGHPEHGYYSRRDLRWGRDGDYETSPEVHPIFGYLWARQVLECWERLGRPTPFALVEPGAGSGAFATSILTWLRERAPDCFAAVRPVLLDGHPHRLDAQRAALRAGGFEAEHTLVEDWLSRDAPVTGIAISNEFFDALPAHLVERRGNDLLEWYAAAGEDGALGFELGPASTPALAAHFERLGVLPGEGCRAEVSLVASEVMRRLSARLERGYILTVDYGHEARELYASWRREGTLMAFRHHSPQPDPLASPGRLDLTYHVDFTSLAAAAEGWQRAATVSQAEALTALGLPEALQAAAERAAADAARFASERRAAQTLVDPAGLGRIRVLALAKATPLEGLRCLQPLTARAGTS
ncbi:MAG: hypothetical protein GEU80_11075 [Dehalococcoidia bacterium]|nr:hypothetical protein [Dehalococcoidia bacterium]